MKLLYTLLEAVDKARLLRFQQEAIDSLDNPDWDVSLEKVRPKTLELIGKTDSRGIKSNMSLILSKDGCPNINIVIPKTDDNRFHVAIRYYVDGPYIVWFANFTLAMKRINFIANVLSLKAALLHEFDELTLTSNESSREKITFTCKRHDARYAISVLMDSASGGYAVTTVGEGESRMTSEAAALTKVKELLAIHAK